MSAVTFGAVFALLLASFIIGSKLQFFKTDKHLLQIFISATIASLGIFLLTLYISCSGKRGSRIFLSIVFLVFALGLLIAGLIALLREPDVIPAIAKCWAGESQADKDLVQAFQDAFECCGWNFTDLECAGRSKEPCVTVIKPNIEKYCTARQFSSWHSQRSSSFWGQWRAEWHAGRDERMR